MKEILIITGLLLLSLVLHMWNAKYVLKHFNLAVDMSSRIVNKIGSILDTITKSIILFVNGYFVESVEEVKKIGSEKAIDKSIDYEVTEFDQCGICGKKYPKIYVVHANQADRLICVECKLKKT